MSSVSTQRTIIFFHSNTSNFQQNLPSCDSSLYFLQRAYYHTPEIILTIQVLRFSPTRPASIWPFILVFPKDLFQPSGQNTWPLLWVFHWGTSVLFPWIICWWHGYGYGYGLMQTIWACFLALPGTSTRGWQPTDLIRIVKLSQKEPVSLDG